MALGRARPDDVVERDELDRAAAVQQRRAVAEARGVADQRAGAERRVQLVAGQREDSRSRSRPCRSGGAARAGRRRRTAARRARARSRRAAPAARPRRSRSRRRSRRRGRSAAAIRAARARWPSQSASAESVNGSSRTSWRRHGSMFAWCSTGLESTRAPAGSAAASTLIASVVLRTNTTVSRRAGAGELGDDVARALERLGRDLRLDAAAAVDAAVPRHERLDGGPHLGERGRARRVVEVHVAAHAPVDARHLRVVARAASRIHARRSAAGVQLPLGLSRGSRRDRDALVLLDQVAVPAAVAGARIGRMRAEAPAARRRAARRARSRSARASPRCSTRGTRASRSGGGRSPRTRGAGRTAGSASGSRRTASATAARSSGGR